MTPALLRSVGLALYGPHWQTFLARDLEVSDRTIRRWAGGMYPIPDIRAELFLLLRDRREKVAALMAELGP